MRHHRIAPVCLASVLAGALVDPVSAQQVVGAVGAANAAPTARLMAQAQRVLKPGADIFFKDHIATKRGGSAQIMFLDRSTLNIGENSDVVIDEFVYRPGEAGTMRAKLNKGFLKFVGGDISHGGGTTIATPTVTIGIRGGIGLVASVKDAAPGSIPGAPADFRGGTIVVNGYGTLTVANGTSSALISRPGFAVFVGQAGGAISAPVRFDMVTAQALLKGFGSHGTQHGGVSTRAGAQAVRAVAAALPSMDLPIAHPVAAPLNGLDFTAVVSAGSALARNRSQGQQATQLQQQLSIAPMTMPAAMAPATPAPVVPTPVATAPVVTAPVAATPVVTTPIVATPVVTTPVVTTPVVTIPVVATPVATPVTTPVTTAPVVATPVATPVTTPVTTAPIVATPIVATPVATAPVVTTPVVATPVATAPVITAPIVATPVATPVATAPVVTTPVVATPVAPSPVAIAPVVAAPAAPMPMMPTPVAPTPVTNPPPNQGGITISLGLGQATVGVQSAPKASPMMATVPPAPSSNAGASNASSSSSASQTGLLNSDGKASGSGNGNGNGNAFGRGLLGRGF